MKTLCLFNTERHTVFMQNRRMHFMISDDNPRKTAFHEKQYGFTERHSILKEA